MDYKLAYAILFSAITRAIDLAQKGDVWGAAALLEHAQRETEGMYLEMDEQHNR